MPISNPTMIQGVIAVLFTAIFLLDVLTPLGLPLSVFYVIPLALTSLMRRREAPYWLAGASSAATVCGYVLSPSLSGVPSWLPVINRGMCLALFWITAVLMRAHLVKEQGRKCIEELQGRLAAIVASSSDAIVSASLDGTVRTWNEGAQRMFGYGTDEMVGRTIRAIISADRYAEETELFERMAKGERIEEYETIWIRKDGTALDVSLTVSQVRDPQGSIIGVAKIVRDITERKRTDAALRQSEERFARFMQQLPGLAWIKDLQGRYVYANNAAQRAFQATQERLYGKTDEEVFAPEVAGRFRENDRRALAGEAGVQVVETLEHQDGLLHHSLVSKFPIAGPDGRTMLVGGMAIDITELKQADEALRKSKERFDIVSEAAEVGFWFCDLPFDELIWDNRVKEHFWLPPDATVTIKTFYDRLHPDDRERTRKSIEESIANKTRYDIEYRTVSPEGVEKWIRAIGRTFYNENEKPIRFDGVTLNITARKKSETVLINKNKDLETLLYVTSHDLKEPLRAIESFSQLVLERYADRIDASGCDYLRRIVRATRRLDRLLNDILELSRAQRMLPPIEEVEAEALVKEALTRLDNRIQETGASVRIISPLPRLRVNRTWATQGLYNLLANAMKFTRDGHAPEIEIAPYEVPASATPFAGVVVKDRGPGVPTRQAERIFMLFQRAVGREVDGTGAGLAIVHQVAERHGGRAWVQPRAGGGSEFVMTFARPTHKNNGGASPT